MSQGLNPGYFNRYVYTMNNPINNIDPNGAACIPCVISTHETYKSFSIYGKAKEDYLENNTMRHAVGSQRLSDGLITGRFGAALLGYEKERLDIFRIGLDRAGIINYPSTIADVFIDLDSNKEGRQAHKEGRSVNERNLIQTDDGNPSAIEAAGQYFSSSSSSQSSNVGLNGSASGTFGNSTITANFQNGSGTLSVSTTRTGSRIARKTTYSCKSSGTTTSCSK